MAVAQAGEVAHAAAVTGSVRIAGVQSAGESADELTI